MAVKAKPVTAMTDALTHPNGRWDVTGAASKGPRAAFVAVEVEHANPFVVVVVVLTAMAQGVEKIWIFHRDTGDTMHYLGGRDSKQRR